MARDTHPTLLAYQELAYTAATTPRSFPSITWQTNDVVAIVCGEEGSGASQAPPVPAAQTGLTWSSAVVDSGSSGSRCGAGVYTAVATQGASAAIQCTLGVSANWGASLFHWRGNTDGVGQRFVTASPGSTRTINVTPTDTHSGYVWGIFDWNTNSYTNAAFTPTATDSRQIGLNGGGGGYMVSVADLTDLVTSTQTGFGLTATAPSAGVFSIVGAEILGTTSGAPQLPPDLIMAPPDNEY